MGGILVRWSKTFNCHPGRSLRSVSPGQIINNLKCHTWRMRNAIAYACQLNSRLGII